MRKYRCPCVCVSSCLVKKKNPTELPKSIDIHIYKCVKWSTADLNVSNDNIIVFRSTPNQCHMIDIKSSFCETSDTHFLHAQFLFTPVFANANFVFAVLFFCWPTVSYVLGSKTDVLMRILFLLVCTNNKEVNFYLSLVCYSLSMHWLANE